MSVWFCIPSARPPGESEPVLRAWRERGYKIALFLDSHVALRERIGLFDRAMADHDHHPSYPGYAEAVNLLCASILHDDPACDWIVTGGDDTLPDPNHSAEEIAKQCTDNFAIHQVVRMATDGPTFGVMQPTGDRFAGGSIDRIAGSPWLGREWCLRANQGRGPFHPGFTHMFGDQCLQEVAMKLGVFWQRPDLIHLHRHFQRESDALNSPAVIKPRPPHLDRWNTREHWDESKALFDKLKADGFKECLPT